MRRKGLVLVLNKYQRKWQFVMLGTISKVPNTVFSLAGKITSRCNLTDTCLFGSKSEHFDRMVLKMIFKDDIYKAFLLLLFCLFLSSELWHIKEEKSLNILFRKLLIFCYLWPFDEVMKNNWYLFSRKKM